MEARRRHRPEADRGGFGEVVAADRDRGPPGSRPGGGGQRRDARRRLDVDVHQQLELRVGGIRRNGFTWRERRRPAEQRRAARFGDADTAGEFGDIQADRFARFDRHVDGEGFDGRRFGVDRRPERAADSADRAQCQRATAVADPPADDRAGDRRGEAGRLLCVGAAAFDAAAEGVRVDRGLQVGADGDRFGRRRRRDARARRGSRPCRGLIGLWIGALEEPGCRNSVDGASRTRTGDLLGAIHRSDRTPRVPRHDDGR